MNLLARLLSVLLFITPVYADSSFVAPTATGQAATGQIPGTATNDNAASGKVGEYISNDSAGGVSLTTNAAATVATITLSPGDWDVSCSVIHSSGTGTIVTYYTAAVSDTTNTLPSTTAYQTTQIEIGGGATNSSPAVASPLVRVSTTFSPQYFCIARAGFSVSTFTAAGRIRARRER